MKEKDLFRAMSDIDERFILEAAPDEGKASDGKALSEEKPVSEKSIPIWKRRSFRWISSAAAACLVLFVGIHVMRLNRAEKNAGIMENQPDQMAEVAEESTVSIKAADASQAVPVSGRQEAAEAGEENAAAAIEEKAADAIEEEAAEAIEENAPEAIGEKNAEAVEEESETETETSPETEK